MFNWLISLFRKNEPEEVEVHFKLPDGKELKVTAVKSPVTSSLQYKQQLKCKEHWEYQGLAVPTNNCNVCWEIYSQKLKR